MLESITDFTNIKIGLLHYLFQWDRDEKEMDVVEVHALFSLLYTADMMRASHMNIDDFYWTDCTGVLLPCYAKKKFCFLIQALRYDNINTRDGWRELNQSSAIWETYENFWQIFVRRIYRMNTLQLMKWWYNSKVVVHSRFICRKTYKIRYKSIWFSGCHFELRLQFWNLCESTTRR